MHRRVQIEIDIDGVPSIGHNLYLSEFQQESLEDQIKEYRERHAGTSLYEYIHVEDCIWVWSAAWCEDGEGVHRLHVELCDRNPCKA